MPGSARAAGADGAAIRKRRFVRPRADRPQLMRMSLGGRDMDFVDLALRRIQETLQGLHSKAASEPEQPPPPRYLIVDQIEPVLGRVVQLGNTSPAVAGWRRYRRRDSHRRRAAAARTRGELLRNGPRVLRCAYATGQGANRLASRTDILVRARTIQSSLEQMVALHSVPVRGSGHPRGQRRSRSSRPNPQNTADRPGAGRNSERARRFSRPNKGSVD